MLVVAKKHSRSWVCWTWRIKTTRNIHASVQIFVIGKVHVVVRAFQNKTCSKAKAPWQSFVVCPIPCRFALCALCFACVRIPKSLIRICSHGQLFRSVYPGSLTVSPGWEHAVCLHHHACPPHLLRLGKDLSLFSLAPKGRRGHPCRLLCWIEQIRSLSRLSSVEE